MPRRHLDGVIERTRPGSLFKESDPPPFGRLVPRGGQRIFVESERPSEHDIRSRMPSTETPNMDFYPLAKYVHLLALFVAAGVTAVTKLAAGRRMRARTVGEALDWHTLLMSAAKLFPICLLVLATTGGYMLSVLRVSMSSGFVVAGLLAIAWLLASGAFLGVKGGALKVALEEMAATGADQPVPNLVPPTAVVLLPAINTGVALAVALDMVAKPTSIPIALGIVAVGVVLGALTAPKRLATAARQPVAVPES